MSITPKRSSLGRPLPMSEGRNRSRTSLEMDLAPRTPKTPQSTGKGGHGLWKSFNGNIVDNYSDLGSIGSIIVPSPASIILPSSAGRDSNRRILKKVLQFPIPDKFKQAMPHRSDDSSQVPLTPDSKLKPIEQKSFYGNSHSLKSPRTPFVLHEDDDDDNDDDKASTSGALLKTPELKKCEFKKPTPVSKPKSQLNRVSSVGKVTKRTGLKKKFGMNKGVQHAIRKPGLKKKKRLSIEKSKKPLAQKTAQKLKKMSVKNLRELAVKPDEELYSKPVKSSKLFKKTAKKSGKISVAQCESNVQYEIQNGMPVFRLRRSPRKQPPKSPLKSPYGGTLRKTPAKLFTPSSTNDYLGGSPQGKRRGPSIPSPVKFDVDASMEDDKSETGEAVSDLIASLCKDDDSVIPMETPYSLYLNDDDENDDFSHLASTTAQELEDLAAQDAMMAILSTPKKASPRKGTPKKGTPRRSPRKPATPKAKENVSDTIKSILESLPPPTEEEVRESRTPKIAPLGEIGNSPTKSRSPVKMFSIFEKGFGVKSSESSQGSAKKTASKRKLALADTASDYTTDGLKQAVIDAGQKKIGAEHCLLCDFVYTIGDASDEKLHMDKHNSVIGIIKHQGWRTERVLREFDDGKIILVRPGDPKRHWEKVESVLEIVDRQLGVTSGGIHQPDQSKAFLFIGDGRIAGFLLAETIAKTDNVSLANVDGDTTTLHPMIPEKTKEVLIGISRIWVEESFQFKGVATRLTSAMRSEFLPGKFLKASEFGFTHTTPSGSAFACKYLKQQNFITYSTV